MQSYYHVSTVPTDHLVRYNLSLHSKVNFTIVSLIFIGNTVGYIAGAITNVYLNDKIGQSSFPVALIHILNYIIIGFGKVPPLLMAPKMCLE
jgi:uncharacterized membrane protein YfcA